MRVPLQLDVYLQGNSDGHDQEESASLQQADRKKRFLKKKQTKTGVT